MIIVEELKRLLKAKDYGRLQLVRKQRADGKIGAYWVDPTEEEQPSLFDNDSQGKESREGRGYFDKLDQDIDEFSVKPLVEVFAKMDPQLAKRIEAKYAAYPFDRDTKEMDLKLDYETADFMNKIRKYPNQADDYRAEFHEKTDNLARQINNRKRKMLKLKVGAVVEWLGERQTISRFSERGFPQVGSNPVFFEELGVGA